MIPTPFLSGTKEKSLLNQFPKKNIILMPFPLLTFESFLKVNEVFRGKKKNLRGIEKVYD